MKSQSIGEFLSVGGPVVWILLTMSVVALTIIILKIWHFVRVKPEQSDNVDTALELWRSGKGTEAIEHLDSSTFSYEVVHLAMQEMSTNQVDEEVLKEELERVSMSKLQDLRSMLPALEAIGTLSPLLGLLGTVLGMISAFQAMEAAGTQADPSVLSGGIWQALITTALGLSIAIPATIAFNWMDRIVQRVAAQVSDSVTQVFTFHHMNRSQD